MTDCGSGFLQSISLIEYYTRKYVHNNLTASKYVHIS